MGAQSRAVGPSLYQGPLGPQAPLQKMLEHLGDVSISPWRCSPCARCVAWDTPPHPEQQRTRAVHFHQQKNKKCGKTVWGQGGYTPHISYREGIPLR